MAIFIKVDGSVERYEMPHGEGSLEALQKKVGGLIEIIPLADGLIFIGDEEAKLASKPINQVATTMWLNTIPFTRLGVYLAGDFILCNDEEVE